MLESSILVILVEEEEELIESGQTDHNGDEFDASLSPPTNHKIFLVPLIREFHSGREKWILLQLREQT